jgi:nucleoside-diphosphate-sugar epimerase
MAYFSFTKKILSGTPIQIFNHGHMKRDFTSILEEKLGIVAKKELLPIQPGDVEETFADVSDLMNDVGFQPSTPLAEVQYGLGFRPTFSNFKKDYKDNRRNAYKPYPDRIL